MSFVMNIYSQVRPLVLLPFNIWFFFASLPFRIAYSIYSGLLIKKTPLQSAKDTVIELKEEILVKPQPQYRHRALSLDMIENRQHGWYSVEMDDSKKEEQLTRRRKSFSQSKDQSTESQSVSSSDDVDQLRGRLSQIEQREQQTLEQKQQLELQLDDLTKKFNSDEQALASFETEKRRFKNLIGVEQRKCFDFQQQIIGLKNQLKSEHESKIKAEGQLDDMKKMQKTDKRKAKKTKKSEASKEIPAESTPATSTESTVTSTESAWHQADHHKDFTEMVAEAQREQVAHPKFSEILKESIKKDETAVASVDAKPEFVVVGGDLSSQHVVEDIQIISAK